MPNLKTKCYYCDSDATFYSEDDKGIPIETCANHFKYRFGG